MFVDEAMANKEELTVRGAISLAAVLRAIAAVTLTITTTSVRARVSGTARSGPSLASFQCRDNGNRLSDVFSPSPSHVKFCRMLNCNKSMECSIDVRLRDSHIAIGLLPDIRPRNLDEGQHWSDWELTKELSSWRPSCNDGICNQRIPSLVSSLHDIIPLYHKSNINL